MDWLQEKVNRLTQTSSEFQISSKYFFHFLNAELASSSLSKIPLIGKIIIFTATLHLTHSILNYLPIFFFWKLNMENRRIYKCILLLLLCLIIKNEVVNQIVHRFLFWHIYPLQVITMCGQKVLLYFKAIVLVVKLQFCVWIDSYLIKYLSFTIVFPP